MVKVSGKRDIALEAKRIVGLSGVNFTTDKEYEEALAYATHWYGELLDDVESAKMAQLSPEEYAEACVLNGLSDGEYTGFGAETVEVVITKPDEQEIIEATQEEVKRALSSLSIKASDTIALYYKKHAEANEEFFEGKLSYPLITIDKMNNKTLGSYNPGENQLRIENHIQLNRNFVAMNTEERVLQTLVHEMIHQWQDEVMYLPKKDKGGKAPKPQMVRYPVAEKGVDDEGRPCYIFTGEWTEVPQKPRPKEWHNVDFRVMASVVGITAFGDKCYGEPAIMPPAESYNRKFLCNCVASNGHPVTIWCTRQVDGICNRCKKPYREVPKGGKSMVRKVKQSHIEKPGTDAVRDEMLATYKEFKQFKDRADKLAFLEDLKAEAVADGVYQKEHNAFKKGYHYWVAYTTKVEAPPVVEAPSEEPPVEVAPPVAVEPEKPKRGRKKKVKAPVEVDAPEAIEEAPAVVERRYDNPEDLILLYRELGSLKAIAKRFEVSPASITYQKKKYEINFGEGTYKLDGEILYAGNEDE